jgi:hypothetical protein
MTQQFMKAGILYQRLLQLFLAPSLAERIKITQRLEKIQYSGRKVLLFSSSWNGLINKTDFIL